MAFFNAKRVMAVTVCAAFMCSAIYASDEDLSADVLLEEEGVVEISVPNVERWVWDCDLIKEVEDEIQVVVEGKDFKKTAKKIAKFSKNAQKVESILTVSGISSSAPAAFTIAGLSLEMLRTVNHVNQQILEFNGASLGCGQDSDGAETVIMSDESLDPITFLPLIVRAIFATLPKPVVEPFRVNPVAALVMFAWLLDDYDLTQDQAVAIISAALSASMGGSVFDIKNELAGATGPQKVQIATLLSFSTGCLAVTVPQMKTMVQQVKRIKESKKKEI